MEGLSGFPSMISPNIDDFSTDYYQYTSEDYTEQDQSWFGFAYNVAKGFNTNNKSTRGNQQIIKKTNNYNYHNNNKISPSSRNYTNYSSHNHKSTSKKYRFSTSFVKKYKNRLRQKLNDIPEDKSDPQNNKLTVETLKRLHKFYSNTTSPQPLVVKHLKNKNKDTDDENNNSLMLFDNNLEPPPIMSTSQIIHPSNIDKLKIKNKLKRSNSYPLLNEEKQYYIFDHAQNDPSGSLLFDTNFYKQNNIKNTQCDSDQKSHTSNDSKNSFARKMHHEFTSTIQSLMLQNYNNNVRSFSGCSSNTSNNKKNNKINNTNNLSKKSLNSNFVNIDHENVSVISDTSHVSSNWSFIE